MWEIAIGVVIGVNLSVWSLLVQVIIIGSLIRLFRGGKNA